MKTIQMTDEGLVAYAKYINALVLYKILWMADGADASDYLELNEYATEAETALDISVNTLPR